jgi:GDP-L-fucose synthase
MLDVQSRSYRQQHGCNFITAVPNNLYGKNDNFHLEDSHVIPAIIRKIWEAKLRGEPAVLWGDGSPLREFTYAEDIGKILVFLLDEYSEDMPINIGQTDEISIKDLAARICQYLNYDFEKVQWDASQPTGQLRKPSCNKRLIELGWRSEMYHSLDEGLKKTCEWFIMRYPNVRGF